MKIKNFLVTLAALSGLFLAPNVQATCSNFATYADGQVLTASSLNSLQTNYTNCVNAVLDGDTLTGNMLWHSGSDALFYSDTGSTLKAAIYGDGARAIIPLTHQGDVNNCGISVASTTFTIAGDDGSALSATNPCQVALRSNTAGRTLSRDFNASVTFTFGATSDTDGNDFGITNTVNWGSVMPFFLGVVYDGTTPYFTISRLPLRTTGAASTDICQKGDTDCDAQTDVMILATGLTLSAWVNLPITQLGWFNMTYATTGGAWTATVSGQSGFNENYESILFTMPIAQMGASASKYFADNGGTAPTYTARNAYSYSINSGGMVTANWGFQNTAGGTAGVGANDLRLTLPYIVSSSPADQNYYGSGNSQESGGTVTLVTYETFSGISYMNASRQSTIGTAIGNLDNVDQSSTAREIYGSITFNAL